MPTATLPRVTVYYFTRYDIRTDEELRSKRPATREAIFRVCGNILEETAEEVDPIELDERGFLKM
jgi:hypothetical protein